ncbi:G-protein coupled receptor 37-like 1 isoform X2 [Salvelinus sp. IW2-2015]|uniref:G-protein coupled receptor 37-like 1 isoform X2 n=1 Tax=Salvelinus sp. IW2-2015 TaxID=2691554 RepID=UPI000CDF57B5|nr:prosaposin receptor GPR37L1 isoform X2 [Salvelinus alpinus]
MTPLFALFVLFLRAAEPRHVGSGYTALRTQDRDGSARVLTTGNRESDTGVNQNQIGGGYIESLLQEPDANPKRIPRGANDGSSRKRDQQSPHSYQHPRPYDPDGYFTTPKNAHLANSTPDRDFKGSVLLHNPLYPVTSLGVATFSLCALTIDRFHAATSPQPQAPRVEPCQSILAKLSVVWIGSMVLAAPELLLWQLTQEVSVQPGGFVVDLCVRRPSLSLPESVYSLVLTYHEARMWWCFGCYFCLPLLFTLACQLVTRHVVAEEARRKQGTATVVGGKRVRPSSSSTSSSSSSSSAPKKQQQLKRERRLSSTVVALAIVYAACNLPENVCNIALAYIANPVSTTTEALLALIGQFLLFVRCSVTPVLFLCLCRSLGQAFMDCCCCCCEECLPDGASSSLSSSTTATAASTSLSSPSSLSPSSTKEEKLTIVSGTTPAIFYDKAKDSSSLIVIGTPC